MYFNVKESVWQYNIICDNIDDNNNLRIIIIV